MVKQVSFDRAIVGAGTLAETALTASRQAWLASLGAVAISRQWARHEAANTFRALARHGATVEKDAIRVLGDRVETSIATATSLLRDARRNMLATVNDIAETTAAALPQVRLPAFASAAPAVKPRRSASKRAARKHVAKPVRRAKRKSARSK
ncbi:MAG TPA: hypothetical protein VJQ49_02955 [Casimicrobiaceae bacterium]|nr:hypothetical protein [Casimicrobiaceae bacterium]